MAGEETLFFSHWGMEEMEGEPGLFQGGGEKWKVWHQIKMSLGGRRMDG